MIKYVKGNLFEYLDKNKEGKVIFIPQVNNNQWIWGSGFVIPVMKRWPAAYPTHKLARSPLGVVEYDMVEPGVWLLNMVCQEGIGFKNGVRPLRYEHLVKCMVNVRDNLNKGSILKGKVIEIYAPKFGSLRSGGTWEFIEDLINEIWADFNITIFEYEEK